MLPLKSLLQVFELPQFVMDMDMFAAQVPNFNIRGRKKVKTSAGVCASIFIIVLTLLFGLLKLQHLVMRNNPSIVTNTSSLEFG